MGPDLNPLIPLNPQGVSGGEQVDQTDDGGEQWEHL